MKVPCTFTKSCHDKTYAIPDCVISLYEKCVMHDGRFKRTKFIQEGNTIPEVKKWFFLLYKNLGSKIDPKYIFYTCIAKGLTVYSPVFCATCGKLVTRVGKNTCSSKCAKRSPEYIAKAKAYFSSKEFLDKRRNTCLKRYGTPAAMQAASVKTKYKETIKHRYGTEYFTQCDAFKKKRHKTCLERYGSEEVFASDSFVKNCLIKSRKSRMYNYYPTFARLLKQKGIAANISQEGFAELPEKITFTCKKCGHTWDRYREEDYGYTTQHICCPKCSRLHASSHSENAVYKFIKKVYSGRVLKNVKGVIGRKELDIYIPEKHLAIEFNGDYYHGITCNSTVDGMRRKKDMHITKTRLCNDKGIRLIHIFEYEWKTKRKKILWLLKSALGIYDKVLYARKCEVVTLSSQVYEAFLDAYHLQGSVKSSVRLGLVHDGKLVAVMGFGKSRFAKGETELHRFCVKAKYSVIGGFSKLLKHSKQNNFVSYIDIAHFTGQAYLQNGFRVIGTTKPSYVYVQNSHVLSRYQCQKHKLKDILADYDPNLSESDNMLRNRWLKIYDCGNIKVHYCK